MSVEIDCYRLKRKGDDKLEKSFSLDPGSFKLVNYFRNIRLLAFCAHENEFSRVIIKGRSPGINISLKLYEDDADEKGKWIFPESDKSVLLTGKQQLSICSERGKYRKQVFIYLDRDNGNDHEEEPIAPEGEFQPIIS